MMTNSDLIITITIPKSEYKDWNEWVEENSSIDSIKRNLKYDFANAIRRLGIDNFDINVDFYKNSISGVLTKKNNSWYVKWSDLHSYAEGTIWFYTQVHPDCINDNLIEGEKVDFEYDNFLIDEPMAKLIQK